MRPIVFTVAAVLLFAAAPRAQTAPVPVQPPPPTPGAISLQTAPYKQETIEIKLAPKEGMEYKYELDKGQALLYSWTSTAPVHYELHSEPTAGPKGYAEFFDQQDDREQAHGSYIAPFAGIHGWFWENRSDREMTIRLTTSGFYSGSLEFRRAQPVKRKPF
jgi:hypothetical protein